MFSINRRQMDALSERTRERWLAAYEKWLLEDFPDQAADQALTTLIRELDLAAREIGARSPVEIYRVMSLAFLPPQIAELEEVSGALGRALTNVQVSIENRLQFIEQVLASRIPWPPATRAPSAPLR